MLMRQMRFEAYNLSTEYSHVVRSSAAAELRRSVDMTQAPSVGVLLELQLAEQLHPDERRTPAGSHICGTYAHRGS